LHPDRSAAEATATAVPTAEPRAESAAPPHPAANNAKQEPAQPPPNQVARAETAKAEPQAESKEPMTAAPPGTQLTRLAQNANPPKGPNSAPSASLAGTVIGVMDAATLVVGEELVRLQGVAPGPADLLGAFAGWARSRSPVECQQQGSQGEYRCLSNNGVDIAEAAILNGFGRAAAAANPLYKQRESEARQAHRGLWQTQ